MNKSMFYLGEYIFFAPIALGLITIFVGIGTKSKKKIIIGTLLVVIYISFIFFYIGTHLPIVR